MPNQTYNDGMANTIGATGVSRPSSLYLYDKM